MDKFIAIIDYGLGNLRSVEKAVEKEGGRPVITRSPELLHQAAGVILPGVGAFGPAVANLRESGLWEMVQGLAEGARRGGKPFLGICLGIQLLFPESEEAPGIQGLGVLHGRVVRFQGVKTPQIGWNRLHIQRSGSGLFRGVPDGSYAYFVHSYYVVPADSGVSAATAEYGQEFTAAVQDGNLMAVQFHPEKSSTIGLGLLRNFVSMVTEG